MKELGGYLFFLALFIARRDLYAADDATEFDHNPANLPDTAPDLLLDR